MYKLKLFGTSGIRGSVDELLTRRFCYEISIAFTKFLKKHNKFGSIAVSMDPRTSGPRIKSDVFNGLSTTGVNIFDQGSSPIPSLNWLIKNTPIKAAIMITGSHIASNLNGLKFFAHNEEISYEDEIEIEKIYYKTKGTKKIVNNDYKVKSDNRASRLYTELLLGLSIKNYPKWKIALDCANGAQSFIFPNLLEKLGFDVVLINCDPHKDFIGRDTDTDDKAEVELLKKTVVDEKCDFGIAFDGDGDRSIFIDNWGEFVPGEYTCTLVSKTFSDNKIVTTIASSQVIDNIGKKIYRTKVGSPYVVGKMKDVGARFGFEQNGGAIFSENMYTRDGGTLVMHIINLLARHGGKFSDLVDTLPKFYMHRTKVDYKWELRERIIKSAKKKFSGIRVDETDGLKIWIDDSTWILFRSSKNAPEFRVFAESKDNLVSRDLLKSGFQFVKDIVKKYE